MSCEEENAVPEGYVCLVSKEGREFLVETQFARLSSLVKHTLDSGFRESQTRRIELRDISADCLEITCKYFHHKMKYKDARGPVPELDLPADKIVDLIEAANFLKV